MGTCHVSCQSLQRSRPLITGQRSHAAPRRAVRAAGLAWPGAAAKIQRQAVEELLAAVDGTNRGVSTTPQQRAAIEACVQRLEEGGDATTTPAKLDATWRVVWTTEKETLFILQWAGLFGTTAGEVWQVIDTKKGELTNVIEFPPEGAFIVDSDISIAGAQRCEFSFTGAKLKLPNREFTVPPVGKGWFSNVFVGKDLRIAKDSRGDTLIVARDGPPREFA